MLHPGPAINHISTIQTIPDSSLALYIHIPFCQTRCTYCAFNTYTGQSSRVVAYMRALIREIEWVAGTALYPAPTIYFGGGTPSLVPVDELACVIHRCADLFTLAPDVEITLEANPGTVDRDYLIGLRQIGINRLSIGMQSAHGSELRMFARGHSLEHVQLTVEMARTAGFDNVNLDLIYGVPLQTMEMWQASVERALEMEPAHVSLYGLGLEDGTPLERWVRQGRLPFPDPDLAADMYEWASERLDQAGFDQYEISNWARPGYESRHNMHYWRNLYYLGLGAGAHGYAAATRYVNTLHPAAYIRRLEAQTEPLPFPLSAAAEEVEPVDREQAMVEMMLMGLRLLREGIALADFRARFGVELWEVYGAPLDRMIGVGLIERSEERVRLTRRGRLLANRVFEQFV